MKHDEVISKMTLRQKADFVTGKDFWQTQDYADLDIPSAFCSDGPHGIRKQAAAADHLGLNASIPATCYPTAATMANSWNDELGEMMGEHLGQEAAVQRVNVLLGPGANIKRVPQCGRNFEYFSEDPYLAGKMAASYIRGIQKNGISACVKHFAGNNIETRRMVNNSVIDERTLREIYLTQFEMAVKEGGTKSIMTSYNLVNGEFANENKHLLVDILRGEWGYEGAVITDWAGCNDRVEGIRCGSDLEMPSCRYGADDVVKAVEDGSLKMEELDACVDRLLSLVEVTHEGLRVAPDKFDEEKHHQIAQACAEESIVLLENKGALPLNKTERVAIIGDFAFNPRYQGAGSSVVNPTKLDTVSELADKSGLNVIGMEKGFNRYGKKKNGLKKKALKLAAEADTVLYFAGLDEITEAEGLDRSSLSISQNQIDLYNELKATGKKVVVCLSCGSAVETAPFKDADGLVYMCLSGQAGAMAVLNIVSGKVCPSGKMAETFPVKVGDSAGEHYPSNKVTTEYREGPFVGYRYYQSAGVEVSYPFGYGLSYTSFEYSDLNVTENGVSLKVKNTGDVDGKEIIQLYVGKEDTEIIRPKMELKGFKKVMVKAGEEVEVSIGFDDKTFRYFNVKTNGWEVEGGTYQIYVGASSQDIRLKGEVVREGTTEVSPYDDRAKLACYFNKDLLNVDDEAFSAIIGGPIPKTQFDFYKKKRMKIHENCTVEDLRYSPGWVGRTFSWAIRFVIGLLRAFGSNNNANTLVMGVLNQPVRGVAKFGGMSRRQMEGLLTMFNGKFFKGLKMFLSKEKKNKEKVEG